MNRLNIIQSEFCMGLACSEIPIKTARLRRLPMAGLKVNKSTIRCFIDIYTFYYHINATLPDASGGMDVAILALHLHEWRSEHGVLAMGAWVGLELILGEVEGPLQTGTV